MKNEISIIKHSQVTVPSIETQLHYQRDKWKMYKQPTYKFFHLTISLKEDVFLTLQLETWEIIFHTL